MDIGMNELMGFAIVFICVAGWLFQSVLVNRERRKGAVQARFMNAMFEKANIGKTETVLGTGRVRRVNLAFCRLLGYSPEELVGRSWTDLVNVDDLRVATCVIATMSEDHRGGLEVEPVRIFIRYIDCDGNDCPAYVNFQIFDEIGNPTAPGIVLAEVQDVTEFDRIRAVAREERGLECTGEVRI